MNAARRKMIGRALELLERAQEIITEAAADEREAFENMPESLQASERGEDCSAAAGALEEAESTLGDITSALADYAQ